MVPLGTRALGIQSVNSAWPDFPAGLLGASLGLLTIFVAMLFLSLGRTGLKGKLRVGVHRFRLSSLREPRLRSG